MINYAVCPPPEFKEIPFSGSESAGEDGRRLSVRVVNCHEAAGSPELAKE
jgi:hypothetical protein